MKDIKEALNSHRKPDITHVRKSLMTYAARSCEYGIAKNYTRANYQLPPESSSPAEKFRAYLRAALSHTMGVLDSIERLQAHRPGLPDSQEVRSACYAPDTDTDGRFPASGLPHICGAAASIMMAIEYAVQSGLLPADPGRPWESASDEPDTRVIVAGTGDESDGVPELCVSSEPSSGAHTEPCDANVDVGSDMYRAGEEDAAGNIPHNPDRIEWTPAERYEYDRGYADYHRLSVMRGEAK